MKMAKDTEYGDEITLLAISKALKVNIRVISPFTTEKWIITFGDESFSTFCLIGHDPYHRHYLSSIPLQENDKP